MQRRYTKNNVKYKFVLYKIKKLVSDSRGKLRYVNNFDNVIDDVFGVPNVARKMSRIYDNSDYIELLDRIGLDYLLEIFNSSRLFDIFSEMIAINYRIEMLKKQIKKDNKKGKRDKSLIKEYNYLSKLYRDSVKLMRKRFGIKSSKNAYKRQFRSLNDFVHRYDDDEDDFTSILLRDDDFFFEDDDDDEYTLSELDNDDDYYETSELEDFERMMNGGRRPSHNRRRKPTSRRPIQNIDDFDLDEEDDDDEYSESGANEEVLKQMNALAHTVQDLSSTVQAMAMRDEYQQTTVNRQMKGYDVHPDQPSEISILTEFVGKLSKELVSVKSDNKVIAKALDESLENQNKIMNYLNSLVFEDDDDSETEVVTNPPVMNDTNEDILEKVNRFPDVYEELQKDQINEKTEGVPETVEELIDMINQSGNDPENK